MKSNTNFPVPGTLLWAVDVELQRDVFRSGAASKPNVEYLRYDDLDLELEGRIPEEAFEKLEVKPGHGISLFLERQIPNGYVAMDASTWKAADAKRKKKFHWWGIDQGHPVPSGLELIYDGDPAGHCTLTPTRTMSVKSFLSLVSLVTFSLHSVDLYGPTH